MIPEMDRRSLLKLFAITPVVGIVPLPAAVVQVAPETCQVMTGSRSLVTILTNKGFQAMLNAIGGGPSIAIDRVAYGTEGGYHPRVTDIDVDGRIHSITSGNVAYSIIDENTLGFRCILDETEGDFMVGNVGLFSGDALLIKSVLPKARWKHAANPPGIVGNRREFNVILSIPVMGPIT